MGYNMYVCPGCQKVFKVQGANKKVKCSQCSSILCDTNVSIEEWGTLDKGTKDSIKQQACLSINNQTSANQTPSKPQTISCPQCGAENAQESKFCTSCGFDFVTGSSLAVTPAVAPIVTPITPVSQPKKSSSLFDGFEEKVSSPQKNAEKTSANLMKCPSCGADIESNSKKCSYCGASITYSMRREQEQVNKEGCPKCGSSNITFNREKQGEVKGKKGTAVIRRTVGVCKDCGHTWVTSEGTPKNNKIWLWVLGWIFIFPLPLTLLLLRKKDMKPVLKYGIIAVAWIFYLLIGKFGNTNDTKKAETKEVVEATQEEPIEEKNEPEEDQQQEESDNSGSIYADAEIVDLMSGIGNNKIGTISVTRANQADCTDEAIADWYFNYVQKNSDCNYHIIVYSDNPTKGVYSLGKGFVQKDVNLIDEKNGTYSIGDDAGSTYYNVDEDNKTITVRMAMADETIVDDIKSKVDAVIPDEYKNGNLYAVDVAGPEGSMDCNLTLINESFANSDCQSIAVDLASQIKDLDLGIGYFCIAFQKDDNSLNALSSLDNLTEQDPSEITTKTFDQ